MKYYPEDDYDRKEIEKLKLEKWQVDCLKLNPGYCAWGPYEDYMCDEKSGWNSPLFYDTWNDFEGFEINDLNEIVNFYFFVNRDNHECDECESGYNKETQKIYDDYYDFNNTGRRWANNITQDEVEALCKSGRLNDFIGMIYFNNKDQKWYKFGKDKIEVEKPEFPSAKEVNIWSKRGIGHDAINCSILVRTGAKRLGVYGFCEKCNGECIVYNGEKGKLGIVFWLIHPRKGASRVVEIKEIKENQLESAFNFLKKAASRNAKRFEKVVDI